MEVIGQVRPVPLMLRGIVGMEVQVEAHIPVILPRVTVRQPVVTGALAVGADMEVREPAQAVIHARAVIPAPQLQGAPLAKATRP